MAEQGRVELADVFARWGRAASLAPGQTGGRVPDAWARHLSLIHI